MCQYLSDLDATMFTSLQTKDRKWLTTSTSLATLVPYLWQSHLPLLWVLPFIAKSASHKMSDPYAKINLLT